MLALIKGRILFMQLVTIFMGYFVGAHYEQGTNLKALLYGLLGTAFVSAGAGALNHFLERDSDKKMERTKTGTETKHIKNTNNKQQRTTQNKQ